MAKYEIISDLIEKRIRLGDYALKGIPAEEMLASEVGVARMTARRAMVRLVEKGLLVRLPNGRLAVNRQQVPGGAAFQFAMLTPAFATPQYERWRIAAAQVASKLRGNVRKVDYVHWEDPTVLEAMDRFEGVVLLPNAEEVPETVLSRLCQHRTPLVVIDGDWSAMGVHSIDLMSAKQIRSLLDHLAQLGHRRIACLNTQPLTDDVCQRIGEWERWMAGKGFTARLINEPVPAYEDPLARSYQVMSKFLQARKPDFTAVLAVTMAAAIGTMRAMHDAGIAIGREISVCGTNDEGFGPYLYPTLTSTQMPDPAPFLEVAFEWMLRPTQDWGAPMLLQPPSVPLFIGASTGPCLAAE